MSGARMTFGRRDFLKVCGTGLAGVALFGAAACGGDEDDEEGGSEIVFSWIPEQTGTLQDMIERFNEENGEGITVTFREMPRTRGSTSTSYAPSYRPAAEI